MSQLPPEVHHLIELALSEDQTFSDPTTGLLVPPELQATGLIRAKAHGVLAGVAVALEVFRRVDPELETRALLADGDKLVPGAAAARIYGSAGSILRGERIALNFVQRMSGIATETARYVQAVQGCRARIVDTRKTVPGHRFLDKYAVRMGGGHNHRMNLADGILIKDNHIAALASQELGLGGVVRLALEKAPHTIKVEVEAETLEQVQEAVDAGAPVIMLDNMAVEQMRRAVRLINGRAVVEASGGITLDTVRAVAETGVDIISIGGLTHSPKALDLSLDLEFAAA
ncbi:MAG: carboxylating nicotinate-nucleotide diphosphorylase [SAR202 cluster bacterium]|nr:carboxylating nicotinate-nucleotide diphosphorylase [SAR202 cluster bacterium]